MAKCKSCARKAKRKARVSGGVGALVDYSQDGLMRAGKLVLGGLLGRVTANVVKKQVTSPMAQFGVLAVGVLAATSENEIVQGAGIGMAITGAMNTAVNYAKSGNAGAAKVAEALEGIGEVDEFTLTGFVDDYIYGMENEVAGTSGEAEVAGDDDTSDY
jgi:hypothetical protein